MNACRALAGKPVSAVDEAQQRAAAGGDAHLRTEREAVRPRPDQIELGPVGAPWHHVVIQERLGVRVGDEHVETAVVVEVGDGDAAAVASRVDTVLRGLIAERLPPFVVEQPFLLAPAQALVPHRRPVARVRQVDAGFDNHLEDVGHVAVGPRGHPAVGHVEIEPPVVVVVEELRAPSPARVGRAGFTRDVGEGEVAVVVPQKVPLAHVLRRDVGHVDVEQAVVVEIAPLRVHPLFGVDADRLLGDVSKCAAAGVDEEPVGAEIARHVQIVPAVVVRIAVAEIERPPTRLQTDFRGDVRERAVAVVVVRDDAAAVVRRLEALGKEARRVGVEQIDRLEIGADEEIREAVVVVIEGDGRDRVQVAVESRRLGDVPELAAPQILEELVMAESHDQQVGAAVVVDVEPERVGGRVGRVVPRPEARVRRDVGKRQVAVVVIQMIASVGRGVGDEHVGKAVSVVVGDRRRRAERRVAGHDVRVRVVEPPRVMRRRDAGLPGDVLEPPRRLRPQPDRAEQHARRHDRRHALHAASRWGSLQYSAPRRRAWACSTRTWKWVMRRRRPAERSPKRTS